MHRFLCFGFMLVCAWELHAKIVSHPTISLLTRDSATGQEIVLKSNRKLCDVGCGFMLGGVNKLPVAEELKVTTIDGKDYIILPIKAPSCHHAQGEQQVEDTLLVGNILSEKPSLWNGFKAGTLILRLKVDASRYFDITSDDFTNQVKNIPLIGHHQGAGTMK